MTTRQITITLDVSTFTPLFTDGMLTSIADEAADALIGIGLVRQVTFLPKDLATKRWSREDFASRLDDRVQAGEFDLPELFAKKIIESITGYDARHLADVTDEDWEIVDLILDGAIERFNGAS